MKVDYAQPCLADHGVARARTRGHIGDTLESDARNRLAANPDDVSTLDGGATGSDSTWGG